MHHSIVVGLCLAGSTFLPGQKTTDAPRPNRSSSTASGFVLDAGEHDLRDIIDRAAGFLGRNYIFHAEEEAVMPNRGRGAAAAVGHTIHLQKKLILDAVACEEVVSQLAHSRGFVIVPIDALRGIYEVIALRGNRSQMLWSRTQHLTPAEVRRKARMRTLVVTVVPLRHLRADYAAQQLRPFFSTQGVGALQFGTVGTQSNLLLKGFADQVAGAIRLLEKVDVPGNETQPAPTNYEGQLTFLRRKSTEQGRRIESLEGKLAMLQALLGEMQVRSRSPKKPATGKEGKKD